MATLYIAEYERMPTIEGKFAQAALEPSTDQTLTIGTVSTSSSAFSATTHIVRLHTDAICSVKFSPAPTATSAMKRLAAGSTEYFAVPVGQVYKVAVITNS